uniref:TSA: Wollemia nobilis Ref_Wollemi_Transcript_6839_1283 transcribed RNA sequence n=1 Tax=Wollemia nobilis TaxID=56998 RepID=A0A0C9RX95_9CONI
MAAEGAADASTRNDNGKKKRKPQYLAFNKPSKSRHSAVRAGVQGFFITCDGGRESQARNDALKLLDKFYEELLQEKGSTRDVKSIDQVLSIKPTRTVFKYSDDESSSSGEESDQNSGHENIKDGERERDCEGKKEGEEILTKKRRLETDLENAGKGAEILQTRENTIDKILEAEIEELGDREKAQFTALDSGCNGVVFIRMRKESGSPSPSELVEYLMNKAASKKKHLSRFILRLLPVELTCYASAEEIAKAAKPLIEQHFPTGEDHSPIKFAVLYEARANTGLDRSKIIDTVAKLVPQPHKVDLSNPDKTIIVQIAKTICMIGIVHKFKQLSKYNIRQLTGFKPS